MKRYIVNGIFILMIGGCSGIYKLDHQQGIISKGTHNRLLVSNQKTTRNTTCNKGLKTLTDEAFHAYLQNSTFVKKLLCYIHTDFSNKQPHELGNDFCSVYTKMYNTKMRDSFIDGTFDFAWTFRLFSSNTSRYEKIKKIWKKMHKRAIGKFSEAGTDFHKHVLPSSDSCGTALCKEHCSKIFHDKENTWKFASYYFSVLVNGMLFPIIFPLMRDGYKRAKNGSTHCYTKLMKDWVKLVIEYWINNDYNSFCQAWNISFKKDLTANKTDKHKINHGNQTSQQLNNQSCSKTANLENQGKNNNAPKNIELTTTTKT